LTYLYAAATIDPENPSVQVELANTLANLGNTSAALTHYQRATQLAPDNPLYWRLLGEFAVQQEIQIRETALPAAREALLLTPDDPANLDLMGQVFFLLSDLYTAERFLWRAIQVDPGYPPARLHLGLVYLALGKTTDAYAQLSLATQLAPDTPTSEQALRLLQRYFP
jgi:predicted Zn-dependent protease